MWTERRSNAIQGLQYKNVFRREKGQDRGGEMFLIFWNYLLQFVVSMFFFASLPIRLLLCGSHLRRIRILHLLRSSLGEVENVDVRKNRIEVDPID